MKRPTTWALAVLTAMTITACGNTPMEHANELIEMHQASVLYMVEANNEGLAAREAEYEEINGDCERLEDVTGITYRDRVRYARNATALGELEGELRKAVYACHNAERKVTAKLREFRTLNDVLTEETIQESVDRLRLQLGRAGQEAVAMILERAESDEAAWASLVTALGNKGTAETLTREQIDTGLQGERSAFDAQITELQTAIEQQVQAREKWDPILAEIQAGTWDPETSQ